MSEVRTIRVEALTRVEGEGALRIRLNDGQIDEVQLNIYEPPRFFEALLRGRALEDVPDITARICGICPVAYQMSSVHALEAALGVQVTGELRRLRRLLYCGEWIESHALHVHMLHLPDFLGYDGALSMVKDHADEVNRGLQLRKFGNRLLDVLGGRAVHPVNVAVGGFYRLPRREELSKLIPDFEWGLQAGIDATLWIAGFDFPQFEQPYDFVAVSHPDEYAMCEGAICTSDGLAIGADQFEQHFREQQVPHSTALQAVRLDTGRTYFLGPLARINLNRERLLPIARGLADEVRLEHPCRNVFKSILARSIEIVQAYEEALTILKDYRPAKKHRIAYRTAESSGACSHRSAARLALSSVWHRRRGPGDIGQHHSPHVAESGPNRSGFASVPAGRRQPARRASRPGLRAAGAFLRSVHQLLGALSQSHAGPRIMSTSSFVVGIGSSHGDDCVGWEVARQIAAVVGDEMSVRCACSPVELLDWLDGVESLEICDAFVGDSAAGTVICWQWPAPEIEQTPFLGSHDLSLPAVLALAEKLERLPPVVRIWGVGVKPRGDFSPLSDEAATAVLTAVERICGTLKHP